MTCLFLPGFCLKELTGPASPNRFQKSLGSSTAVQTPIRIQLYNAATKRSVAGPGPKDNTFNPFQTRQQDKTSRHCLVSILSQGIKNVSLFCLVALKAAHQYQDCFKTVSGSYKPLSRTDNNPITHPTTSDINHPKDTYLKPTNQPISITITVI